MDSLCEDHVLQLLARTPVRPSLQGAMGAHQRDASQLVQGQEVLQGEQAGNVIVLHCQPLLAGRAQPPEVGCKALQRFVLVTIGPANVDVDLVLMRWRVPHQVQDLRVQTMCF